MRVLEPILRLAAPVLQMAPAGTDYTRLAAQAYLRNASWGWLTWGWQPLPPLVGGAIGSLLRAAPKMSGGLSSVACRRGRTPASNLAPHSTNRTTCRPPQPFVLREVLRDDGAERFQTHPTTPWDIAGPTPACSTQTSFGPIDHPSPVVELLIVRRPNWSTTCRDGEYAGTVLVRSFESSGTLLARLDLSRSGRERLLDRSDRAEEPSPLVHFERRRTVPVGSS